MYVTAVCTTIPYVCACACLFRIYTYGTGAPEDDDIDVDVVGEKGGDEGGNEIEPGDVLALTCGVL